MQVNYWISRARPIDDFTAPITNLDEFVASYRSWFDALNPSWRTKNNVGRWVASGSGAWDNFSKPGPNGMLSILACLKWWFDKEVLLGIEVTDGWVEAVADLIWVLRGLIEAASKLTRYVS